MVGGDGGVLKGGGVGSVLELEHLLNFKTGRCFYVGA
jgi:hypothetical protein